VVGGHVDFANQFPSTSIPLYRGKKLRILAVQSDRRLKSIPEIPTVKELGLDAEFYAWVGIYAPKGTPMDIVKKLREVTVAVAKEKSFIDTIENTGDEVYFRNGDELAKYMDHESEMFSKIYKQIIMAEKK
jgi:tripartite-type tricarboxylate transporter receptor subunit TctC